VTAEAFGIDDDEPKEGPGPVIPATMAVLGLAFVASSLLIAGLPPLPAFLAKASMLSAILAPRVIAGSAWILVALLLATGLASLIALARAGVGIFWAEGRSVPRVLVVEMAPVAALLFLCVALTLSPASTMTYLRDAANAVHAPAPYVKAVLPPR